MIIEVHDDVVDKAIADQTAEINDALCVLRELAMTVRRGKHIVVVECLKDADKCAKLQQIMGKNDINLLKSVFTKRYDYRKVSEAVTCRAIISYDNIEEQDGIIVLNPTQYKAFEFYQETYLITENIIDAEFYRYIFLYFVKGKGLSGLQSSFYSLMGGGATLADVMKHETLSPRHFCVAIADSDKASPQSSIGNTAQQLQKVWNNALCKRFCSVYVMQRVREIENLIPIKLLKSHSSYKDSYNILFQKEWSYYDMKCGVTVKNMFDKDTRNYWKGQFSDCSFEKAENLAQACPKGDEYRKAVARLDTKDAIIVDIEWGNKLLYEAIHSRNGNYGNDHVLKAIEDADLTEDQKSEWLAIGELMFNWTCSFKPARI